MRDEHLGLGLRKRKVRRMMGVRTRSSGDVYHEQQQHVRSCHVGGRWKAVWVMCMCGSYGLQVREVTRPSTHHSSLMTSKHRGALSCRPSRLCECA